MNYLVQSIHRFSIFCFIYYFSVTQNLLHGQLPANIGLTLPNLEVFAGIVYRFTNIGKLRSSLRLNFEVNRPGRGSFEGLKFLDFLTNCTNLVVLRLAANYFYEELR